MISKKDTIKYIGSKDVRKHLREIDYEPSYFEASWFVYRTNRLSLWQKFEILRDLQKQYGKEDWAASEGINAWMVTVSKYMNLFELIEKGEDIVYAVGPQGYIDKMHFRTYQECIEYMKSEEKFDCFEIERINLNNQETTYASFMKVNDGYEMDFIDTKEDVEIFNKDLTDVPLPFKDGDVIRYTRLGESKPVILTTNSRYNFAPYDFIFDYEFVDKEEVDNEHEVYDRLYLF